MLVAQEVFEGVLTQDTGHKIGLLHNLQRLVERFRQRLDAHRLALGIGKLPHVVAGRLTQGHLLFDAVKTGREQHGEREIRVDRRVERAELHTRGIALAWLVLRDAQQRGPVVVTPADVARRFRPTPQTLVRVDVLVGDRANLRRMVQDASGELARDKRHVELLACLVEGVGIAFEQAQMRVHTGTRLVGERFGHKARVNATFEGNLFDHGAEGHDVVRGGQRVGIPQVDLVLAWTGLMMRVFNGNAHLLEHVDGRAAEIHPRAARHVVEVPAFVDGCRGLGPILLVFEQVELDFRVHVEGEALLFGFGERLLEHVPRIAERRFAVRGEDVAEHACGALRTTTPRQNLEGGRVRLDDHVVLGNTRHAFDRRTVETKPFLERRFEFGGGDGH